MTPEIRPLWNIAQPWTHPGGTAEWNLGVSMRYDGSLVCVMGRVAPVCRCCYPVEPLIVATANPTTVSPWQQPSLSARSSDRGSERGTRSSQRARMLLVLGPSLVFSACPPSDDDSGDVSPTEVFSPTPEPATEVPATPTPLEPTPIPYWGDVVVKVDTTAFRGPAANLFQVNQGPIIWDGSGTDTYDFTRLYQLIGISGVRTQDNAVDVCTIYTDDTLVTDPGEASIDADQCKFDAGTSGLAALWSANDPAGLANAANYDFSTADEVVKAIVEGGFELMLRLGESFNGPNDVTNPDDYAKAATQIYLHYAVGWPDSDAALAPEYIEIFNEPDGQFWQGTPTDFYQLYAATYDGVGGPEGATGPLGGPGFTADGIEEWLESTLSPSMAGDFLTEFSSDRLDYFSVHFYDVCGDGRPLNLYDYLERTRAELDAMDLAALPLLLTEYHIGLGNVCGSSLLASAQAGAWLSGALSLLQEPDLKLERAYMYSGTLAMGLFSMDEETHAFEVRPSAFAMRAHSALAGTELTSITLCDNEGENCVIPSESAATGAQIHAVSAMTDSGEHLVLLTHYGDGPAPVSLDFGADSGLSLYRLERVPAASDVIRGLTSEVDANGHYIPTEDTLALLEAQVQVDGGEMLSGRLELAMQSWEVMLVRVE